MTIVVYKHSSLIQLNIGELEEFNLKNTIIIFLTTIIGGGENTRLPPSTFHIGGSPPFLALPLSTPLVQIDLGNSLVQLFSGSRDFSF